MSRAPIEQKLRARGIIAEVLQELLPRTESAATELEAARAFARRRRLGPHRKPELREAYRRKDLMATRSRWLQLRHRVTRGRQRIVERRGRSRRARAKSLRAHCPLGHLTRGTGWRKSLFQTVAATAVLGFELRAGGAWNACGRVCGGLGGDVHGGAAFKAETRACARHASNGNCAWTPVLYKSAPNWDVRQKLWPGGRVTECQMLSYKSALLIPVFAATVVASACGSDDASGPSGVSGAGAGGVTTHAGSGGQTPGGGRAGSGSPDGGTAGKAGSAGDDSAAGAAGDGRAAARPATARTQMKGAVRVASLKRAARARRAIRVMRCNATRTSRRF